MVTLVLVSRCFHLHFLDEETEAQTGYLHLLKATESRCFGFMPSVLKGRFCAPGEGEGHCLELSRGEKSCNHPSFLIRMEDRIKRTGIKYC